MPWGLGTWGLSVWGGTIVLVPGQFPTSPLFDVYCFGPSIPTSTLPLFAGVSITPGPDFSTDPTTLDMVITSTDSSEGVLHVTSSVGSVSTLQVLYQTTSLPPNFNDVLNEHIFFGTVDVAGPAAGVFLSKAGIAYAGTSTSARQILPGSQDFVSEDEFWLMRIVVSGNTNAVYIYITKLSDIEAGSAEILRYILPIVPYSSCPQDTSSGTWVKVKGNASHPSQIDLGSICLASKAIIPNIPPVADPGPDQAIPTCEILRLDGSGSRDAEGKALTYKWRLIDAPTGSMFGFTGSDGHTIPLLVPTGFTDHFYSASFGGVSPIPISAGDVLVVQGKVYEIVTTGTDINGHFVQITDFLLPDSIPSSNYKIVKQNGISNPTSVNPTFYPDIPGFYKFDLTVFDGALYSTPESVVINVVQSFLPRGVIPDLRFIWNYLSDFWDLVEERDRIDTVWGALAQVAATELYTLWQIEYSKSLRDVQRTFIRRWLHYDLLLREPYPEITPMRVIFRGVDSISILNTGGAYTGQRLDLTIPYTAAPVSITFTGVNPLTPTVIAAQIQAVLRTVDTRFVVTVVPVDGTHSLVRIYAPFSFTVANTSTTTLFALGAQNQALQGVSGILTNPNTYKVDISLLGIDIQENDVLVVRVTDPNGDYNVAARIIAPIDSAADTLRYQRLALKDALPLASSTTWYIPATAVSSQIDFWNGLVTTGDIAALEVIDEQTGQTLFYQSTVRAAVGSAANMVAFDPTAIGDFLAAPSRFVVLYWGTYRRTYMPIESLIVDIPTLQRTIKQPNENEVLRRNLDFFLETYRGSKCLRFDPTIWVTSSPVIPVPRLWGEYNYLDNRPTIEANFGIPVEFTLDDLSQLPSSIDYLSAVRGIWYAFLNGPTMFNLRAGTQILLGLPFAEVTGTITEIRTDFSPTQGRILIQDTAPPNVTRSYHYPSVLSLETNPTAGRAYAAGDTVSAFAPLVKGAEVIDYVKDPKWFQGWMNQGGFFEVEKFHRFIVRVNSAAFTLPSLMFVQNFIKRIKPTYTFPTFIVQEAVKDAEVDVTDQINLVGRLDVQDGAYFSSPGTVTAWDVPDTSPGQIIGGLVQPWVGSLSSHYKQAYDTDTNDMITGTFPTSPTPDGQTQWGFDRPITGNHGMAAILREVWGGGVPADDEVFVNGMPLVDLVGAIFSRKHQGSIPAAGMEVDDAFTAAGVASYNTLTVLWKGDPGATSDSFRIKIYKNGVLQIDMPFTASSPGGNVTFASYLAPPFQITALGVVANDVITAFIVPDGGGDRRPYYREVVVALCHSTVIWNTGNAVAAGTYIAYRAL